MNNKIYKKHKLTNQYIFFRNPIIISYYHLKNKTAISNLKKLPFLNCIPEDYFYQTHRLYKTSVFHNFKKGEKILIYQLIF